MKHRGPTHLYFHAPCLDGLASAVLAWDYLDATETSEVIPQPVSYDVQGTWLEHTRHANNIAVVDFLYHPSANFWFDHHRTTFLSEELRSDYLSRREGDALLRYDADAPSCSALMWRELREQLPEKRAPLVQTSCKTDAARYETPHEAIFGDEPGLIINRSLMRDPNPDYLRQLLLRLRREPLSEVAAWEEVSSRTQAVDAEVKAGVERLKTRLKDGIVSFNWNAEEGPLNRYSAYLFKPEADYSIGTLRYPSQKSAKITVMRNPWKEFDSVPLGPIMRQWGGGGHTRVGSAWLREQDATPARLRAISRKIHQQLRS
jgi:hypothetical protein